MESKDQTSCMYYKPASMGVFCHWMNGIEKQGQDTFMTTGDTGNTGGEIDTWPPGLLKHDIDSS